MPRNTELPLFFNTIISSRQRRELSQPSHLESHFKSWLEGLNDTETSTASQQVLKQLFEKDPSFFNFLHPFDYQRESALLRSIRELLPSFNPETTTAILLNTKGSENVHIYYLLTAIQRYRMKYHVEDVLPSYANQDFLLATFAKLTELYRQSLSSGLGLTEILFLSDVLGDEHLPTLIKLSGYLDQFFQFASASDNVEQLLRHPKILWVVDRLQQQDRSNFDWGDRVENLDALIAGVDLHGLDRGTVSDLAKEYWVQAEVGRSEDSFELMSPSERRAVIAQFVRRKKLTKVAEMARNKKGLAADEVELYPGEYDAIRAREQLLADLPGNKRVTLGTEFEQGFAKGVPSLGYALVFPSGMNIEYDTDFEFSPTYAYDVETTIALLNRWSESGFLDGYYKIDHSMHLNIGKVHNLTLTIISFFILALTGRTHLPRADASIAGQTYSRSLTEPYFECKQFDHLSWELTQIFLRESSYIFACQKAYEKVLGIESSSYMDDALRVDYFIDDIDTRAGDDTDKLLAVLYADLLHKVGQIMHNLGYETLIKAAQNSHHITTSQMLPVFPDSKAHLDVDPSKVSNTQYEEKVGDIAEFTNLVAEIQALVSSTAAQAQALIAGFEEKALPAAA